MVSDMTRLTEAAFSLSPGIYSYSSHLQYYSQFVDSIKWKQKNGSSLNAT